MVKGHALVLADLGLCPYSGTVIRDPDLFAGEFSRARRADHLLGRMGFTQALLALVTDDRPWPLYRGLSTTAAPDRPSGATFVSATFSAEVAYAHFREGSGSGFGLLIRRPAPLHRLVMTFLETPQLNDPFQEAEALLVADPDDPPF